MQPLELDVFSCRTDNYGVLVHDPETGLTASIDAPDAAAVGEAAARRGWTLSHIFTTHHHMDHVEGNLALKEQYDCQIFGPINEAIAIPGLDHAYGDGDSFKFGSHTVNVIETPGHTAGHICYHFEDDKLLFAADTLFALGCGRLFERGPRDMWQSLSKLRKLPDDTVVYFGHEYTSSNAKFALTIDPQNASLRDRVKEIEATLAAGGHTAPTTIGLERATNPFLRPDDAGIRKHLGMEGAEDWEVFAEIRARKDKF